MDLQFDDFEVKVHGKRGFTLKPAGDGDAGYDLYAPENVYLPYGCRRMIDTGVIIETPEPLFCMVVPRSSTGTSRAHGVRIANTVGVIDPSYRGQDDTIKVCLEREQRKKEYIRTFTPSTKKHPMRQAYDLLLVQNHHGKTTTGEGVGFCVSGPRYSHHDLELVPRIGGEKVDVFGYPSGPASDRIFEKGDRFAQIMFLPFARPRLVNRKLDEFSSEDRGGFGSTGA